MRAHRCRVVATLLRAEQAVGRVVEEVADSNPGYVPDPRAGNVALSPVDDGFNPETWESMQEHAGWVKVMDAPWVAEAETGFQWVHKSVYGVVFNGQFGGDTRRHIHQILAQSGLLTITESGCGWGFTTSGDVVHTISPTSVAFCTYAACLGSMVLDRFYCKSVAELIAVLDGRIATVSSWDQKRTALQVQLRKEMTSTCILDATFADADAHLFAAFKPGKWCRLVGSSNHGGGRTVDMYLESEADAMQHLRARLFVRSPQGAQTMESVETMRVLHLRNEWERMENVAGWRRLVDAPVGMVAPGMFARAYEVIYGHRFAEEFQEAHAREITRIVSGAFRSMHSIRSDRRNVKFETGTGTYVYDITPCAVAYCQFSVLHGSSGHRLHGFYCVSPYHLRETLLNVPTAISAWPGKRTAIAALQRPIRTDECYVQFSRTVRVDMTFKTGVYCTLVVRPANPHDTTLNVQFCGSLEEVRTGLAMHLPAPGP